MLPAGVLSVALTAMAAAQQPEQKLPENVQKAKDVVADFLQKIKGTDGQIVWLDSEALAKAFPRHTFFAVRYRIYPVAKKLPDGMAPSNVFAVRDGKLEHLKDNKALTAFFQGNLAPVTKDSAPIALTSYLTLSQEFVQDGFYKFEIDAKGFALDMAGNAVVKAQGRAIAMKGGNGEIRVDMKMDDQGKVAEVAFDGSKLKPGPRPICQATKLLDTDKVVRQMAEQELLFMGLAARDYLMEQRSAASPELRQAIDLLWERIVKNGW
jgi:hypothetical protein